MQRCFSGQLCCPAESAAISSDCQACFYPPKTCGHLQELDAGIKNLKHCCWKSIVKCCLAHTDHGQQPASISVLDAMHYVAAAWDEVSTPATQHCFAKCGFRMDGGMMEMARVQAGG